MTFKTGSWGDKAKARSKRRTRYFIEYRNSRKKEYSAHRAVESAIRKKELVRQPCQVCGIEKSEAHHPDYDKPLEVVWLCPLHHRLHDGRQTSKPCKVCGDKHWGKGFCRRCYNKDYARRKKQFMN